jgi:hypothetical protein
MKMISLKLLVDLKNANIIQVQQIDSDKNISYHTFEVGSAEYFEKERWIVKGEHAVTQDSETHATVLTIERLEKDIDISLNKPAIVAEGVVPEDDTLEEYINTPVTAVVFHRELLISSARDTKKKFVTAYAEACIESYQKQNPQSTREDFAVIEIDWSNKHIELKSIAQPVEKEKDVTEEE